MGHNIRCRSTMISTYAYIHVASHSFEENFPEWFDVSLHVCASVYLHVCTSVYLHACASVYLHVCASVYLHVCINMCKALYSHFIITLTDSEQFGQDLWLSRGMLCSMTHQVHFLLSCNTNLNGVQSNKNSLMSN